MIILGFDPAVAKFGMAVVKSVGNKNTLVNAYTLKTRTDLPLYVRMAEISFQIDAWVNEYNPHQIVIEDIFFNNNVSAINVAKVIGIILEKTINFKLVSQRALLSKKAYIGGIYTPTAIKKSVTGNGRASKKEIKDAVLKNIIIPPLKKDIKIDDHGYDAIAVCLHHLKEKS